MLLRQYGPHLTVLPSHEALYPLLQHKLAYAPRPRNGTIPAPDATVQYVEDARQAARQSPNFTMSTLSLTDNTMPVRPGYGTEGTPITVFANYVPLLPRSDLVLYMYDMRKNISFCSG